LIVGSVTFSDSHSLWFNSICDLADNNDLLFKYVTGGSFEGGYYLNRRLPYTSADFFYSGVEDDIVVLSKACFYNRPELLSFCNITGDISEPELIAALFLKEGPDFVKRVNGDFAISVFRPGQNEIYLFRDQVGVVPLAYVTEKESLFFSSDIMALCRAFSDNVLIDSEYLLGYFKYIDYRKTPVSKVKKLLPGHYLHFSADGAVIIKYWRPESIRINKKLHYGSVLADLDSLVRDAIRIRCDQRFVAGAHVSGGLDSGIVSILAKREYERQDRFYGFSWSPAVFDPGENTYDEREMVFKTCEAAGITPVLNDITVADYNRYISSYYYNQGYFLEDKVMEQAVERDINMLFSGWGGDEFISTGDRGIEIDLLRGLHLRRFFHRNPVKRPRLFLKWMFYYVINPVFGFLDKATKMSFRDDAFYIKKRFRKSDRKALRRYYFHLSRHQMHLRLLNFYNLQERCESWAINGYRRGIEYRYPLLDRRIIEYMLQVPSKALCEKDGFRPIMRDIGKDILPDAVRLQKLKREPVCWGYVQVLEKKIAVSAMDEMREWMLNEDLSFVDFDRLSQDIRQYRDLSDTVDNRILFRGLIYLKAIHEFTRQFRV
jgi:asparagine synthase (glutamine-hydrolysing)